MPLPSRQRRAVFESIARLRKRDLDGVPWKTLSQRTQFCGVDVHPFGVYPGPMPGSFEAVATLYVTLNNAGSAFSHSFPAYVTGRIRRNKARIDSIRVNLESLTH